MPEHRWVNFKAEGWTLTRECRCGAVATSSLLSVAPLPCLHTNGSQ